MLLCKKIHSLAWFPLPLSASKRFVRVPFSVVPLGAQLGHLPLHFLKLLERDGLERHDFGLAKDLGRRWRAVGGSVDGIATIEGDGRASERGRCLTSLGLCFSEKISPDFGSISWTRGCPCEVGSETETEGEKAKHKRPWRGGGVSRVVPL